MLEAIAVFTIILGFISNTSFFNSACGSQKLAERIEKIYFYTWEIFFATRSARYPTSRSLRLEETREGLDFRFWLVRSNQPVLFSGADREHDQNQSQQEPARDNGEQPSGLSVIPDRPRHHRYRWH